VTDPDDLLHDLRAQQELRQVFLRSRLEGFTQPSMRERRLWGDQTDPPLPRWPSAIVGLDDWIGGGFVGATALAGESGTGKSMTGLGVAVTAAMQPKTIAVYADAENTQGDQAERLHGWCGSPKRYGEVIEKISGSFHWIEWEPGMSWRQLMQWIADRIEPGTRSVQLVLDSVNSIARSIPGNSLHIASGIYTACTLLARGSKGAVKVLGLSELNGNRDLKGLEGVYIAHLALKIVREHDKGPNVLRMHMMKNRTGAFVPDLGLFEVIPERSQIVRYGSGARGEAEDRGPVTHSFGFDD